MNCIHCDQPITLLNSQKNGIFDVCRPCAIAKAPYIRFVLKRKSQTIDDEIVCQKHYQHEAQAGHSMAPLSTQEVGAGMTQTVTPLAGEHSCAMCVDEKMHERGAA